MSAKEQLKTARMKGKNQAAGASLVVSAWLAAFALAFALAALDGMGASARLEARGENSAPGLVVRDINGQRHDLIQKGQVSVLFFLSPGCPVSNRYAPEVNRIRADYAGTGSKFRFYIVYAEPDLTARAAREHAAAYGYRCPVLLDAPQNLLKKTGVSVTPEVAVMTRGAGASGAVSIKLLYRGRIDDRYAALGKMRAQPTRRDLRLALDTIAKGKAIAQPRTRAVGCFIMQAVRPADRSEKPAS